MMKKNGIESLINVEIEVNSHCNRKCLYCPNSSNENSADNPIIMPEKILDKILLELSLINYSGRISYHFYNEPLLRDDLEMIITKIQKILPEALQVLFTNGDLLNEERYNRLMSAGLDYIIITSHSGKKHPERDNQIVQFPFELELTNRGGAIAGLREVTEDDNRTPCYVMSEMIVITANGDIIPCYEDYYREHSLGNIMNRPLSDILNNEKYNLARMHLQKGDRKKALSICAKCINHAHELPGLSAKSEPFWEKLNKRIEP